MLSAAITCGCGAGGPHAAGAKAPFAWLHAAGPPSGWRIATIPTGASIAIPPRWQAIAGDPGTTSAALLGAHRALLGYLNLTPRQGDETLADWPRFRVEHNAEEGQRRIATQAATVARPIGTQRWSCVRDAYTTTTGTRYVEIACLVASRRGAVVAVGAAPLAAWPRVAGELERALVSVRA